MIALLCPTRGRPEQCKRMAKSAYATASNPANVHIYTAFSQGDETIAEYDNQLLVNQYLWPDYPTAYKWNKLAEIAMQHPEHKLFMLAADDMVFTTPCYDAALLDHYNALENKIHVYALQDSRDKDGLPHPIFTREWIEFWGFLTNPIYLHWFVDTWATEVAKANNCFTHMRDYELQHIKPSDIGKPDNTHSRIRNLGWLERDRFVWGKMKDHLEFDKRKLAECLKN